MKLYLMRHGEACDPKQDPQRGLTENGKTNIQKLAKHLLAENISFQQVIHSPKKRARQTAEIMQQVLSPAAEMTEVEYIQPNDDPQQLANDIYGWDRDTLVVSHLPYVPNLLTLLTGKDAYLTPITFETGTIICLESDEHSDWNITWHSAPSEI